MGVFTLDVSTLSGVNVTYVETPFQDVGQTVQVEWVQAGANQDLRLHGYAIRGVAGEVMETDFPAPTVTTTGALSYYGLGIYGSSMYGVGVGTGGFFILDTSVLGGTILQSSVHTPFQERGRSIQVEWVQAGSNQDIRLHGYSIRAVPGEVIAVDSVSS